MIPPLDPRILSQLLRDAVCFGADADHLLVEMAKRALNENRNLSGGVLCLLETYGAFKAQLWPYDIPLSHNVRGAKSWHIRFRVCTQY